MSHLTCTDSKLQFTTCRVGFGSGNHLLACVANVQHVQETHFALCGVRGHLHVKGRGTLPFYGDGGTPGKQGLGRKRACLALRTIR